MKVGVRGSSFDLLAFRGLPGKRRKRFAQASTEPLAVHPVNRLAQQIHPAKLNLMVTEVRDETPSSKSFRLMPNPAGQVSVLPTFRAGQYLSLMVALDDARTTRPYSISSAPCEALGEDRFYEISMQRVENGFLTEHAWDNWKIGTVVESSGPTGLFYHDPLRDSRRVVGLAGGAGITPFRSIAREIAFGSLDAELLLYGSSDEGDILFYDELQELEEEADGALQVVHVLSCDEVCLEGCEQGFITADLIRKYADTANSSLFVCGPQVMYDYVRGELAKLELPRRRVRWELYGERKDIARRPGFPSETVGKAFALTVHLNGVAHQVPAKATETVLVAT